MQYCAKLKAAQNSLALRGEKSKVVGGNTRAAGLNSPSNDGIDGSVMSSCDSWHRLYVDTLGMLEKYRRRVREGILVDDAQAFARYVILSEVWRLMELHPEANPRLQKLFPYDGTELRRIADLLSDECCEFYRGRTSHSEGTAKGASKSDLEGIDNKLNLVIERLAALESGRSPVEVVEPRIVALP